VEKLGVSSTPRMPLLWAQARRRTPFGWGSEGRVFTRNIAAACSSTDGKGGEAEGKKGLRGKGQAQRPSKGFGSSSRNLANADPEGDVSNTEALLQTLGEVSMNSGRDPKSHLVLSDDTSAEGWKEIDEKVNKYPIERKFNAIGTGGSDFQAAMVAAVESILGQSIPDDKVKSKSSSGGKYTSVTIGPCTVETSEQLTAIYQAMATDKRLKWWM